MKWLNPVPTDSLQPWVLRWRITARLTLAVMTVVTGALTILTLPVWLVFTLSDYDTEGFRDLHQDVSLLAKMLLSPWEE